MWIVEIGVCWGLGSRMNCRSICIGVVAGLLYELAYCDDAVSLIGHIVYTLRPLLFRRHHRHCLALTSLHSFVGQTAPDNPQHHLIEYHLHRFRLNCLSFVSKPLPPYDGKCCSNNVLFCWMLNFVCCSLPFGCAPCIVHYWCIWAHMSGARLGVCSYMGGSCNSAPGRSSTGSSLQLLQMGWLHLLDCSLRWRQLDSVLLDSCQL